MITSRIFVFNSFQENTIVAFDETQQAIVIDPGCYEPSEQKELDDYIDQQNLTVKYLLNTHCHIDHVLGNYHIRQKYKVPLMLHSKEEDLLRAVKTYASNYGYPLYQDTSADRLLTEHDEIKFGNTTLEVIFIPGHSPGHVGFLCLEQKIIFSGDVLFEQGIGRTDLPGGNFKTLIGSIHQKLFTLPDDVTVFPGHGPTTTIGEEKISNPFCALSLLKG
jgi:hydroxyacylglutathione hydrolase